MTKAKPVEAYSDCYRLFDLAIAHGGLRLPYPNAKAAIAQRHRLYRARLTYIEATKNTSYNDIYIQLIYADGQVQGPGKLLQEGPAELVLRLHSAKVLPAMTDLDGNPLDDEDLLDAAAEAKGRLGL